MDVKVEQMNEKNMYRFIIEASEEEFEKGVQKAYEKNKGKLSIPGFRKGKVPRKIIEKMYGKSFFYNDAVEIVVPELYEKAAAESDLDIVSRPALKVTQMEVDKPLIFSAEFAVKPEVKLGKYKGVEVEKQDTKVSAKEVDAEIAKAQEMDAREVEITDRPVKEKDITTIDFDGTIDGVPFEGGKGKDYPLTIGSHTFIDTFEDQMIGMNVGDERDIKVKFPDEYHASALKGKDAVFKVKLKEIKERQIPELNDEFAVDKGFDDLKAYKASVKKDLEESKAVQAKNQKEREALDAVIADCDLEIPKPMIETRANDMGIDMEKDITSRGMNFAQYLQYAGLTPEKFVENLKPEAEKRISQRIVLEAIAKAEKLETSDEEYKKELEKAAGKSGMDLEVFEEMLDEKGIEMIRGDVAIRKALDLIVKESVEVEKKAEKKTESKAKTTTKKTAAKDESDKEEKAEKKTTAKKTTTKKAADKDAADKEEKAEKKTTAKKTTTKKSADKDTADKEEKAEKKPAAKKTTAKKKSE